MSLDLPILNVPSTGSPTALPCALDLDLQGLGAVFGSLGEPRYRARQVFRALHQRGAASWDECSELPTPLRRALADRFRVRSGETVAQARSEDGTRKRLVRLADGQEIETVAIPATSPRGARRLSVCVSTQAGCAMACTFCATGSMGFARHLTTGEIVDQVYGFGRDGGARPTHVVFMGMGEPLANYAATVAAIRLLCHLDGAGLSQRRITVSTSGLVSEIRALAEESLEVTLAISLHAPDDAVRSELMPINRRYSLGELIPAATAYGERTGRRVSYEYIMLDGVNDRPDQSDRLAALLPKRLSHVNLIPYNWTDAAYQASPPARAREFRDRLTRAGLSATIRASRGRDIAAACGQLKAENRCRVSPSPSGRGLG